MCYKIWWTSIFLVKQSWSNDAHFGELICYVLFKDENDLSLEYKTINQVFIDMLKTSYCIDQPISTRPLRLARLS